MMKDANRNARNRLLGAGVLCLILSACGAPVDQSVSTIAPTKTGKPTAPHEPTLTLTPTLSPTATSTPTCTPPATPADGSELFQGCWQFESEYVMLDMQLEQQGSDVQGTFLLLKICVVEGERSACRIREGFVEGTATMNEAEVRLTVPEYGDEGTALFTLADDGETFSWEKLEYQKDAVGDGSLYYLPPKFTLIPCRF
jgi:hypothetical protein